MPFKHDYDPLKEADHRMKRIYLKDEQAMGGVKFVPIGWYCIGCKKVQLDGQTEPE